MKTKKILMSNYKITFNNSSSKFFRDGTQKLPKRWKKCIDYEGDSFSHLKDDDFEL